MSDADRYHSVDERLADHQRYLEKNANLNAIVARFREEFGVEAIWFELLDYQNDVGIAIERGGVDGLSRLGIRFNHSASQEVLDASIAYAKKWKAGETEYKGVPGEHVMEGNELCADGIFEGKMS